MTRSEAARLGGLARAAKLTPERRAEIARLGFEAMARKHFGNVRKAAVKFLQAAGAIPPGGGCPAENPPGSAEALRQLWLRLQSPEGGPEGPPF